MSLIIHKISSSSLQVNYSYLGSDLLFGYETVANYTVDFDDVTYTNEQNILFEGIEALRQAYQRKNLVARIGGDEFINGRITNQSFEESTLVGSSKCSITIEESKRLNDYTSHEFAQHIPSPQWIESFSESFTFSRSGDSYSSNRTVSLKYKQDAGNQFLNHARLFLRNFYFNSRPNLGYHVDGISENGRFDGEFRPLISESIDLLNLSVSIQENLETSLIENDYSRRQTYSTEIDAAGYTNKRYSIDIKALREPLEGVANAACAAIVGEIVSENSGSLGRPIEIGKGINKDGGEISINISFTNDPSKNTQNSNGYVVTKTRRLSFFDYSINIEILSDGKNEVEKAQNAKSHWLSLIPTYDNKILSLFSEATTIYEMSRQTQFQSKNGGIVDSVVFTNDPSYDSSSLPAGFLKLRLSDSMNLQVDRIKTFIDLKNKRECVELSNLSTIGSGNFSMEGVAFKSEGIWFVYNYLKGLGFSVGEITYIKGDTLTISSDGATTRVISYEFV